MRNLLSAQYFSDVDNILQGLTIAIVATGNYLCGESRGKLLFEHFHMFDSIFHVGFPHGFEPKFLIKRREVGLCGNPNS